jgi:DNA-binding NarL/FixJ family response regulator
VKIMLVDDHALVRRGLAHVVRESFPDAEVVEAGNAEQALRTLNEQAIEIALVDVRMPEPDGLQLLREIKAQWKDIPVIMLTSFDHAPYVKQALAEGAAGYMLKDATPDDLEQAIRVALSGGGNVLSPRVIQNLFDEMEGGTPSNGDGTHRPEASLTQRETDIMSLLAEGKSNREISRSLFLSEKTVKAHLAAIFRKLGVTNRTQAAMAAVAMGIGPNPRSPEGGEPSETHAVGR